MDGQIISSIPLTPVQQEQAENMVLGWATLYTTTSVIWGTQYQPVENKPPFVLQLKDHLTVKHFQRVLLMSVPVCVFVCEVLWELCVRSTHGGPCSLMVQTENTVASSWPICLVFFLWKWWQWSCREDWCAHKSLSKPHGPVFSGHVFACPNLILSEYTSALNHPFRESLSLFFKSFTLDNTETSEIQYKTFCALYVNYLVNCSFFLYHS